MLGAWEVRSGCEHWLLRIRLQVLLTLSISPAAPVLKESEGYSDAECEY